MAENLFCEERDCGLSAQVFGFVDGLKTKACEKHVLTLIHKHATVYDIAAFAFIQSPEDAILYEQRRGQRSKGLGALTLLESACERSWEEEQKRLQESCEALHKVAQQSYQEVYLRGEECYEKLKADLVDLRRQFEQLLHSPNFQLSPEVSEVCEGVPIDYLFCMIVGDCSLSVAETIRTNFHVLSWDIERVSRRTWSVELQQFIANQAAANKTDIVVRATEYARQFGVEISDSPNEAIEQSEETTQLLQSLDLDTAKNEAEECLRVGRSVSQTGDFDYGLRELQRGSNLLRGSNHVELYLQLISAIADIHLQRDDHENTVEICKFILSTWTSESHSLEFLQALFYLVYSYYRLNQLFLGIEVSEKWTGKLRADCSLCQYMQLCIEGLLYFSQGRNEEGVQMIEIALESDFPPSLVTIGCKVILVETRQNAGRFDGLEQVCLSLCELCSYQFPYSIQYACSLGHLGTLIIVNHKLLETAEEQFIKAIQLFSTYFPQSQQYAYCLMAMGRIYTETNKFPEAEERLMKGFQLYSTYFPDSERHANCLSFLGRLYFLMQRYAEAEEKCRSAIQMYSTNFPQSSFYAECLYHLGLILGTRGRRREAREKLYDARQLHVRLGNQKGIDDCDTALHLLSNT